MEPISQTINLDIRDYIDGLVAYCLQSPGFIYFSQDEKYLLASQIHDYFYQATLEILVNKLSNTQLIQIEKLDPSRPEMLAKMQQLISQMPGLANDIETRLVKDAVYIHQNSKLP